ncbi:Hypothetical predicted protein [Paramuricea clavata]|uniref:Uncharacterized protein n=1 Tax=Paramuricea clavata TaxID=317549 RepID=A0A6S7HSW5_PARCT|nr:Hypothetical predicted protein [Paramuricea clavata]
MGILKVSFALLERINSGRKWQYMSKNFWKSLCSRCILLAAQSVGCEFQRFGDDRNFAVKKIFST